MNRFLATKILHIFEISKPFYLATLAALGLALASPELARGAPPPPQTADVVITANPSNPGNVAGISNPGDIVLYTFSVSNGGSVVETIPVEICSSNYEGSLWTSFDIGPNSPAGDLATSVTLDPASEKVTFTNSGGPKCQTINIQISTGPLTLADPAVAEIFGVQVNVFKVDNLIPSTGNEKPTVSVTGAKNIHIRVNVLPIEVENVACYMTDSSGDFLLDSDGNPVTESGSDDGIFAIVVNKKNIEVATNPGQFYFNLVYWNTSSNVKTVTADMRVPTPKGVVANGRNAVHSAIFGDVFDPNFQASFNCANNGTDCYSTPHGASGVTESIDVPPNRTLLVTYHLEWANLKQPWPNGCSGGTDCPISVTGVIFENGTALGNCTAGAHGYAKQ